MQPTFPLFIVFIKGAWVRMYHLITANLKARPTRTVISIFAVAIGVILILVINGMTQGTLNDTVDRTMGVGADYILQPSDSGFLFALGSPALPMKITGKLREIKGVGAVTPVLAKFSSEGFGITFGIDLASYDQFPGKLQIIEGTRSLVGNEMIVDQVYAKQNKVKPGMQVDLMGRKFTISAICKRAAVRKLVPLSTLQEMMDTGGRVSMMFIKAAPGTDLKLLEEELKKTGYNILNATDAAALLEGTKIPMLKQFSIAVVFISMIISFMVILLAMYTTIFERTREIGILKSLGASRAFVIVMVLRESVMVCFVGVLLGTVVSQVIRQVITSVFPALQMEMNMSEMGLACLLGLTAGLLGAIYPAYKAAQMDPVKALSYE
jgi:putative ABC transport system permease protein